MVFIPIYRFNLEEEPVLEYYYFYIIGTKTSVQITNLVAAGKEIAISGRRCDWRRGSCYSKEYFSALKPGNVFFVSEEPQTSVLYSKQNLL